jgi:hypothetical protein
LFTFGYPDRMVAISVEAVSPLTGSPLGGQGWLQIGELGLALLLSACIGLEREIRQKNAGLRTHTLVGLGAALFMLVSKYGFSDVIETGRIILDPSRMAAQIVSGIGFINRSPTLPPPSPPSPTSTTSTRSWSTTPTPSTSDSPRRHRPGQPLLAAGRRDPGRRWRPAVLPGGKGGPPGS